MKHINIRLIGHKWITTVAYKILDKVKITKECSIMNRGKGIKTLTLTINPIGEQILI
jgi:hypothetical protein